MRPLHGSLLVLFFCMLTNARADEPLPPPRAVPSEPPLVVVSPYYRTSAYAVWQLYGVDRTGNFRPRVVFGPNGAYYLYNGQPYPWVTTHLRDIMPYAKD